MKRPRLLAGLPLLAAVVVAAVVVIDSGSRGRSTASGITTNGSTPARVQRRNLVETDTESGTLGYADPQTVYNRLSGTITWLPAVGRVISPGQTLYGVDGRPVVLFDGVLPAYRTLQAGNSDGQDILQLNRDLVLMGFADGQITINDAWQTGTADAVKRWQASLGEQPTGKIGLGRVVFLPGAQRVTQVQTTCGSTGGGSSGSSGSGPTNGCGIAEASAATAAPHREFVDFATSSTTSTTATSTTATTTAPTSTTATTATTSAKSVASSSENKSGSGSGEDAGAGSGSPSGNALGSGRDSGGGGNSGSATGSGDAGSASAILQTTSTRVVVTVDLGASQQSEATVGGYVTVEMPAGNTVNGRISAVSSVAQASAGGNGSGSGSGGPGSGNGSGGGSAGSTIPVTIALTGRQPGGGLDQAAVSVNFAQAKATNVLSVPVTALLATAGGGYAVQEARISRRLIPVTTGLFAAGYVQISGSGIHPGLQVTDSQG